MAAAAVVVAGGVALRVAGLSVRAQRPTLALAAGVVCFAGAFAAGGVAGLREDGEGLWQTRRRVAKLAAALAAAFALTVGLVWGTWAASGADAYGYVSQARAWANGQVIVPQELAADAPWPNPEQTVSPLGWRPAQQPGAIVPTYAPGLPLVMTAFLVAAGDAAVFWVVPIAGLAVVWLTWRLGRQLAGNTAAGAAAVLMACSPAFVFQVVQPMSDVPVTAWWTAALVLVLAGRPGLAGACASAAILTRPNLAPLAAWLALGPMVLAGHAPSARQVGLRQAATFIAATTPGVVAWLAINWQWYGHPLASGYGSAADLYSLAPISTNAGRYAEWLLRCQSPFVLLGLASPVVMWLASRRAPRLASGVISPDDPDAPAATRPVAVHVFCLVFAGLVVVAYLPYAAFEDWSYLRFLLPAFPVLLVTSCAVATRCLRHVPVAGRVPILLLGTLLLAIFELAGARDGRAFDLHRLERRYVDAGTWVGGELPSNAVLLAVQHSGSLRHYSGRPTLRWDALDPAWLDRTLDHLRNRGYQPYFVLEAWEEGQFRQQFSGAADPGGLDWPPAAEIVGSARVRVYDPRDRARFLAGERVATTRVWPDRER